MNFEEVKAWADDLIANGRWLVHQHGRVGRAHKFYDGVEVKYVSKVNGDAVNGPVLELDTGNGFVADPAAFSVLTASEVAFFAAFNDALNGLIVGSISAGAASGMKAFEGLRLMKCAMRAQLAALEASR